MTAAHTSTPQPDRTTEDALFPPSVRAGDFLFVSGQASVDESGAILTATFAEEMRRSIDNVRRILTEARLTLSDVIKVNAYVHDPGDLAEYNRLYRDFFPPPRPARTTLINCLSVQIKFELDVVAYAPGFRSPVASSQGLQSHR